MVVGGARIGLLGFGVGALFLRPALIDRFAAPLGAALRRPDRLVVDEDKDRIGVGGGQDAQGDPTAAVDLRVEGNVLKLAIGDDAFRGDGLAIDDDLDRHFARAFHSRALDVPVGLLRDRRVANVVIRRFIQPRGDAGGDVHAAGDLRRNSLPFSPTRVSFTRKSSRWLKPSLT